MSGKDSLIIAQQYESFNPDGRWEFWFPKVFNDYRGLNGNSNSVLTVKAEENEVRDTEQWALEVIKLTNAERKKHGLPLFEVNDELMKLAGRNKGVDWIGKRHERPDGTRVSKTPGCGENVGAKKSVEKQVTSWMSSEGHRTNILLEQYQSIGVGCYQAENGRTYWVQIFRP